MGMNFEDLTFDEFGEIEQLDYEVIHEIIKQMHDSSIKSEAHNRAEAIRNCVLMELFPVAIEKMDKLFGPKSLSVLTLADDGWAIYHEYQSKIGYRPFIKLAITINDQNIEF